MKKIICLVFMLCLVLCSLALAQETKYTNDKYGFNLNIPADFTAQKIDTPATLGVYDNKKIIMQLRYVVPQAGYTGADFGSVTKAEIDGFIKRQRFVAAINTNKFAFLQHDTNVNGKKLPYLWAMFVSDMPIGGQHFRTFLLKNYFMHKDIIIELDFIIPEDMMKESTATINGIVDSLEFTK